MFNRCGYPKERFLSGTLSPPANCDHSLIFANLNIAMSNIDWDEKVFYLSDVNKTYDNWFVIFRKVIDTNIPNRIVTI